MFSSLGSYLLPFPSLLGASLSLSFQHPSEASSALILLVQGETGRDEMGKLQGFTVVTHNLYIKNDLKAQTYVSNLCFNGQVGEKNKLQLHKRG